MNVVLVIVAVVLILFSMVAGYFVLKIKRINDKQDLQSSLDSEINRLFRDQQSHGLVLGVLKSGKTYTKGYGVLTKDSDSPPDAQTVFQVGSITKVFTSALLQILSNRGVVTLDATLQDLIGDSVPLSDTVMHITLRQLSTHRSGLPRIPKPLHEQLLSVMDENELMVDPYSHMEPADAFAYLEMAPDAKKPGAFEYSNFGMGLLAHVLERVTGQSYEQLLSSEIFEPLQMNHTGITLTPDREKLCAQGFDPKGEPTGYWHFSVLAGAGAVHSSVSDMLKFIQASVQNESMAGSLFKVMSEPQFGGKSGLGWMQAGLLEKISGNGSYVWHNGMVGGFASYMAIDTKSQTGLVVLTSRAIDSTMLGIALTRQVRTQSWKKH